MAKSLPAAFAFEVATVAGAVSHAHFFRSPSLGSGPVTVTPLAFHAASLSFFNLAVRRVRVHLTINSYTTVCTSYSRILRPFLRRLPILNRLFTVGPHDFRHRNSFACLGLELLTNVESAVSMPQS